MSVEDILSADYVDLKALSKSIKLNNDHFKIYMENEIHHNYDALLDFAKVMSCPLNKESVHLLFKHFDRTVFTLFYIRPLMGEEAINELSNLEDMGGVLKCLNEINNRKFMEAQSFNDQKIISRM